ncbi:MAG: hypothetical protein HY318_01490 [Armatimonadetes bacterium]|nr:hypothetical protein [Armatimonadota bacterium]
MIKVQNDGTGSDNVKVTGTKAPTGWMVNYFNATKFGANITAQVTGAGWPTGTLAVGGSKEIRVEVKPGLSIRAGAVLDVLVTATSVADSSKKDTVKATTTATAPPVYKPDLWIRNSTDTSSIGNNIYSTNGINETKTQSVTKGTTATYVLTVQNDGDTTDSFKITGTGGGAGWTVKYFDAASGGNEKTSLVTGSGWTVGPLAPGATSEFRAEVTPGSSGSVSASKVVLITATSVGDKTKKDTVKATTTAKKSTSSMYGDPRQAGDTDPEVRWVQAPPATVAAGMNYAVSWEVVGGKTVSHTYVVMSTDPDPTRKPMAMSEIQSGKPGVFKAWVPAPSKGHLYYQVVAVVDGKMYTSEVLYCEVR